MGLSHRISKKENAEGIARALAAKATLYQMDKVPEKEEVEDIDDLLANLEAASMID